MGGGGGVWEGHISSGFFKKRGPGEGGTLRGGRRMDTHTKQRDNMATADTDTT